MGDACSPERGKPVWEVGGSDGGHLEPGTVNQMPYWRSEWGEPKWEPGMHSMRMPGGAPGARGYGVRAGVQAGSQGWGAPGAGGACRHECGGSPEKGGAWYLWGSPKAGCGSLELGLGGAWSPDFGGAWSQECGGTCSYGRIEGWGMPGA